MRERNAAESTLVVATVRHPPPITCQHREGFSLALFTHFAPKGVEIVRGRGQRHRATPADDVRMHVCVLVCATVLKCVRLSCHSFGAFY